MAMLATLGRAVDRFVAGVSIVALVALLVVVTLGIVSRAAGEPFSWTEEISGYLMVWLACLGWMLATRNNAHIRIRVLIDLLPNRGWRLTETVTQGFVALVGAIIAWQGLHLVIVNSDIDAVSMPISTAWMYAPLVPAGLITCVQALVDIVIRALPGDRDDGKDFIL